MSRASIDLVLSEVVSWDHGAGHRRAGRVHREAGAAASPPAPDKRPGPAADEAFAGPSRAAQRAVRLPCRRRRPSDRRWLQARARCQGARSCRAASPRGGPKRRAGQAGLAAAQRRSGALHAGGGVVDPLAVPAGRPDPAADRPAAMPSQELGLPPADAGGDPGRGGPGGRAPGPVEAFGGKVPFAVATWQPKDGGRCGDPARPDRERGAQAGGRRAPG